MQQNPDFAWVSMEEGYSWCAAVHRETPPDVELIKKFPEQFAHVPKELADALYAAELAVTRACAAIENWLDAEVPDAAAE